MEEIPKIESEQPDEQNGQEDILTEEEFIQEDTDIKYPKYNNFVIYFFDKGIAVPIYQAADFFKRFKEEHSDLEQKLHNNISKGNSFSYWQQFEPDLYEAYKIMRSYGASDEDLFT